MLKHTFEEDIIILSTARVYKWYKRSRKTEMMQGLSVIKHGWVVLGILQRCLCEVLCVNM